jgi:hypothetical protein
MENQSNKLNIEFVEHMGYYITKSVFEGFDIHGNTYKTIKIGNKLYNI